MTKLILSTTLLALLCLIRVANRGALAFAPQPLAVKRAHEPSHVVVLSLQPDLLRFKHSLQASLASEDEKEDSTNLAHRVGQIEYAELGGILVWLVALSSFILMNKFVGPWPENIIKSVPGNIWLVCHYLGGMLFAGGIIMTTCIEWMVASTKDSPVLKFWFGQVPLLDACVVLPGLTMTMIAGTGVAVHHYGGLGQTPAHIETVFWTLVAFATWWALTDLSTQEKSAKAIEEWAAADDLDEEGIPKIVLFRRISNVISCLFVVALYGIMTLKPGLS